MNALSPLYKTKRLQHQPEFEAFLDFIRGTGATSYLEIGCKFGGSLWGVANAMPTGSRIVAVDLPGQWDAESSLTACVKDLRKLGYDAQFFRGDSTAPHVVAAVQGHAPFDVVLIDANHTEPYVRKDFANYGQLGKYCCFHDIGWNRAQNQPGKLPIDVPQVWEEIKRTHAERATFMEIKLDQRPGWGHNGIGIMQWL
jgi:cephalosporin hydroxylase